MHKYLPYSTNRLSLSFHEWRPLSIANCNNREWRINKNQLTPTNKIITTPKNSLANNFVIEFLINNIEGNFLKSFTNNIMMV